MIVLALALLAAAPAKIAPADRTCSSDAATAAYRKGFAAQAAMKTDDAMSAWSECLKVEPDCVPCLYESGWTHWSRSEWDDTVKAWERVLVLDSAHEEARTWIRQARENQAHGGPGGVDVSVPIGTVSSGGAIAFRLAARFQNYDGHPKSPADHYDEDVHSPKSVRFSADGKKVWVNSLAGGKTVVYDPATLEKKKVVEHLFGDAQAKLFAGVTGPFDWKWRTKAPDGNRNHFRGFPVEGTLTHGGRYLWIPYYRRDWDAKATSPSGLAVLDAAKDEILRVLPTGPIPKYVAASPDGKWLAVVHWGDNTIGLLDISGTSPSSFHYVAPKMVVEQELPLDKMGMVNRDQECGFCLRGTVFTPDSKTLLVARMGGGGIAGFDVATHRYLGTVTGMKPTPRHLALSPDGATLYVGSNVAGYVARVPLSTIVDALRAANGASTEIEKWDDVYVGGGARTLAVSPDGNFLFVAVQSNAELVAVDARTMTVTGRIRADAYPVGLAVAPDGKSIWVTCQGRSGRGGNSVLVYSIAERTGEIKPVVAPTPNTGAGSEE